MRLALKKPEIYSAYRAYFQDEDKARFVVGIAFWSIAYAVLLINDYLAFGSAANFFPILLLRSTYTFLSIIGLILLRVRIRRWQELDRLILVWGLVSVFQTIMIYQFRRPIQANVFLVDLVGCLSFFIIITNSIYTQMVPALIYAIFDLFLVLSLRDRFEHAMVRTVFFTFLGGFAVACFFSLRFFRSRLKAFQDHLVDIAVRAELQRLASTDTLTGVLNRRRLLEIASDAYYRFKRYGRPFSIMFMDLDGFKRINDTFGHQQGDATLIEFAQIVTAEKRESDGLGRMGGDEFCVVLPETSTRAAIHLAERILPRCREIGSTGNGVFVMDITVSIGISQAMTQDDSLDTLLARADAALYQAKYSGRNCWKIL